MAHKRGPRTRGNRRPETAQAAQSERVTLSDSFSDHARSPSRDAPDHEHQVPTKKRASFASLPGELRNTIYGLVLIADDSITVRYAMTDTGSKFLVENKVSATTKRNRPVVMIEETAKDATQAKPMSGYDLCRALRCFSLLDKQTRKEARSFFYSNNAFELLVKDDPGRVFVSVYRDAMYLKACTRFLEHMGADGRASITSLRLYDARNGPAQSSDCHMQQPIKEIFSLLQQCTNLAVLDTNNILVMAPLSLKRWFSKLLRKPAAQLCMPPSDAIQSLATRFSAIPGLGRLSIGYMVGLGLQGELNYSRMMRVIGEELSRSIECEIVVEAYPNIPAYSNFRVLFFLQSPTKFVYGELPTGNGAPQLH